jgi:ribonuclease VapC
LGSSGPDAARSVLDEADVVTVPVDEFTAELALEAWMKFGKGRHPAALNLSDCYSYATARHFDVPLLFIGRDFARTDLQLVDASAG